MEEATAGTGPTVTARLLVLQRKCHYPGEFAPEILAVVDEWTLDENAEWWHAEVKKQKTTVGQDADAWAEIEVDLPQSALLGALYPSPKMAVSAVRTVEGSTE